MASSLSGICSSMLNNSDSELQKQQRKKKRMVSNRESARRSRMRKQNYLDDLTAQLLKLKKENNQMIPAIHFTTQNYMNVETENSILRAQIAELTHRLEYLNDIVSLVNDAGSDCFGVNKEQYYSAAQSRDGFISNSWSWDYLSINQQQSIMAPAGDM
ncbi:bZIP transcription factor 11-like [Impatiens glandulifera]|uniref:bZIP transcription factor 11-like n=1 Tax=Impatiens glandulifera TaxID=253017 RepID=UPI001FB08338|nr:bZIP transcription factor 11-like [Impatiens glandulifera]